MRALRSPAFPALALSALLFASCATAPTRPSDAGPPAGPPPAPREFRAAWVATVANINWPSAPGLPVEEQRREAVALLDLLERLNFNAVVLQVRPQADALYASELEPWSWYLTGEQGKAPAPLYDPLAFWIEEAHARGLELHAWLNPYRAHHPSSGPVTETSLARTRPELVVSLSQGYAWMDPALKATQEHSLAVVRDLVRRYDLDGIHFDDYFYPYPEYNGGADFPDSVSWNAYVRGGGRLSRGDWRRKAVNDFIEDVYRTVKREKRWVKFGLSPFGIWRPGHPESIRGFDQHAVLYADARLWLNKGWVDYFTPQLYWPIGQVPQSYPVLLGWWAGENTLGRHLWPGINVGRAPGARGGAEAVDQIMVTRGMLPASPGNVHWSIGPLARNDSLAAALAAGPYAVPALVPASPWMDRRAPAAPRLTVEVTTSGGVARWDHPDPGDVFRWVVRVRTGETWSVRIVPGAQRELAMEGRPSEVVVSAVDRVGNESGVVVWRAEG